MEKESKEILLKKYGLNYSSVKYFRKYGLFLLLFFSAILFAIILGGMYQSKSIFEKNLLENSKSKASELNVLKQWLMKHKGVYVYKNLAKPNAEIDGVPQSVSQMSLRTDKGDELLLKRFSHVSKELSSESNKQNIFAKYHTTSLNPINKVDLADTFEQNALKIFKEQKVSKYYDYESVGDKKYFRYLEPMVTEKKCMKCHHTYGFNEGNIDSALSIKIDVSEEFEKFQNTSVIIAVLLSLLIIFSIILLRFFYKSVVKDLKYAEKKLVELALIDPLTGLFNRANGYATLEKELKRHQRSQKALSIIMLDIDKFKSINDNYGHDVGDEALRELGRVLSKELRTYDFAFRYGGEEFIVILPETDIKEAFSIAERMRKEIEINSFIYDKNEKKSLQYTVSIGCATYEEEIDPEELIKRSDEALYEAKENGRNRVHVYKYD